MPFLHITAKLGESAILPLFARDVAFRAELNERITPQQRAAPWRASFPIDFLRRHIPKRIIFQGSIGVPPVILGRSLIFIPIHSASPVAILLHPQHRRDARAPLNAFLIYYGQARRICYPPSFARDVAFRAFAPNSTKGPLPNSGHHHGEPVSPSTSSAGTSQRGSFSKGA
jgi:hypothetical protein